VVKVVTEGIKDMAEWQVQLTGNFFGTHSHEPVIGDNPNCDATSFHNFVAAPDTFNPDYVRVFSSDDFSLLRLSHH
jgi:hypothetical protein